MRSRAGRARIYILKRDILRVKAPAADTRGCRRQGGEREDKTGAGSLLNPRGRIGNAGSPRRLQMTRFAAAEIFVPSRDRVRAKLARGLQYGPRKIRTTETPASFSR